MTRQLAAALILGAGLMPVPAAAQADQHGVGIHARVAPSSQPRAMARLRRSAGHEAAAGVQTTILGGRPAACDRFPKARARWCGCAAAIHAGLPNGDGFWNLASNWFRLRRTSPGPGMAAVRSGHVAILKNHLSGSIWMAYDPNSGQQLARLHAIDLRQYAAVVDPSSHAQARRSAGRPTKAAQIIPEIIPVATGSEFEPFEPLRRAANLFQRYFESRDVVVHRWATLTCPNGRQMPDKLVRMMGDASAHFAATAYVNSGFRSVQHNRRVGGARGSEHIRCRAVDWRLAGVSIADLRGWLVPRLGQYGVRGLGFYRTHLHTDARPSRVLVTWQGSGKRRYARRPPLRHYATAI